MLGAEELGDGSSQLGREKNRRWKIGDRRPDPNDSGLWMLDAGWALRFAFFLLPLNLAVASASAFGVRWQSAASTPLSSSAEVKNRPATIAPWATSDFGLWPFDTGTVPAKRLVGLDPDLWFESKRFLVFGNSLFRYED